MWELRRPRLSFPSFLFVQVSGVDGISAPAGSGPATPQIQEGGAGPPVRGAALKGLEEVDKQGVKAHRWSTE